MLRHFKKIQVFQIGCGGIGSWIVIPIFKLLSEYTRVVNENNTSEFDVTTVDYKLFDDDIVELQNIKRQNFLKTALYGYKTTSIGKFLSFNNTDPHFRFQTTTTKINNIHTLNNVIRNFWSYNQDKRLNIFIGCVDNVKTRYIIEKLLTNINDNHNCTIPSIYIDGGNEVHYGQVITNLYNFEICPNIFLDQDKSKRIDLSSIFPEKDKRNNQNQGCAVFGAQTLGINHMVGSQILIKLQSILIDRLITPNHLHFSTSGIAIEM